MLRKLRERIQSEERGFTLIELLVVVLIIGILAAIAIPSFLSQTDTAKDAEAKSAVRNAQTAAETYNTNNNGSYENMTDVELEGVEESLVDAKNFAVAVDAGNDGYQVTVESESGNTFTIDRNNDGTVNRTCVATVEDAGCPSSLTW